ncbi:MAG: radical SAM protein [Methanomicrobiales archaeon]|nr:radical SAM protein [Methanomicrobiales archaeon]
MRWHTLKARLLERGSARVTGLPADAFVGRSTAGPSAGGEGSVFFSIGGKRVRLSLDRNSPVEILHEGCGAAVLRIGDQDVRGVLEPVGLHCPRQAYVTISESCIFRCRYCRVPFQKGRTKTPSEVRALIEPVRHGIDAICLTGGVADTWEKEEQQALATVRELGDLDIPIGVSIYPGPGTPGRLYELEVAEVKFNMETATESLFQQMCPELDRALMWQALRESMEIFGEGKVFSNLIIGLGETDEEIASCIGQLTEMGVIPVLRPLTPAAGVMGYARPSAERLLRILEIHGHALKKAGLSTRKARTMCTLCTGCDLVPGRDT